MATDALDRNSWILDADTYLVQFKVSWKHSFLKCQNLFLYLLEMNSLQKCGYRTIRQKQINKLSKEWTLMSSICGCLSEIWFWIFILGRNSFFVKFVTQLEIIISIQTSKVNQLQISKISIETSKAWTLIFSLCGYQTHDF